MIQDRFHSRLIFRGRQKDLSSTEDWEDTELPAPTKSVIPVVLVPSLGHPTPTHHLAPGDGRARHTEQHPAGGAPALSRPAGTSDTNTVGRRASEKVSVGKRELCREGKISRLLSCFLFSFDYLKRNLQGTGCWQIVKGLLGGYRESRKDSHQLSDQIPPPLCTLVSKENGTWPPYVRRGLREFSVSLCEFCIFLWSEGSTPPIFS